METKPVYFLLKPLLKLGFRGYFRKNFISGLENIPKDKPVMFVANHTNTLIDPVVIAAYIKRNTYFITRGDIFGKPAVAWFFKQVRMLPIFRKRDGMDNMKKNQATFDECYRILENKGAIIIFIEGDCEMTKHLRKMSKGTARIVFEVEKNNDFSLDTQIIPVGLNYNYHHKDQIRKDFMMSFGKPIPVKKYEETSKKSLGRAVRLLNKEIRQGMLNELVHIENLEDENVTENLFEIYRNNIKYRPLPLVATKRQRLEMEQGVANKVYEMRTNDEEQHEKFSNRVKKYVEDLTKHNVDDLGVSERYKYSFLRTLVLVLTYPIYLIGYLLNRLPIWRGQRLAETLIKDPMFFASVNMVSSTLFYLIYSLVIFIVTSLLFGPLIGLGIWVGLLFLGLDAMIHSEYQQINRSTRKYHQFKQENKEEAERLQKERQEIMKTLGI